MKALFRLLFFCMLAHLATAKPAPYVSLPDATAAGQASVTAEASGLGSSNLTCTLTNLSSAELRLRVPPGLHFEGGTAGAQDLLTYQQQLLVLAPGAKQVLRLRGFCMEAHDFSPHDLPYTLRGFAGRGLRPLADSLYKYPLLAEDYGQSFVWAVTDKYALPRVFVLPALERGATNTLRYLATLTGQPLVPANRLRGPRVGTRTFAKKVIMLYHSPEAQVASLQVFGANNKLVSTLFSNRKLGPGVVHYTYGVNAVVGEKEKPVFRVRLLGPAGQVLKEVKVDDATEAVEQEPATKSFVFEFKLTKPANYAHVRVRLRDGTLVEDLSEQRHLPIGNFRLSMGFHHLYPTSMPFVVRLETKEGQLLAEQALPGE